MTTSLVLDRSARCEPAGRRPARRRRAHHRRTDAPKAFTAVHLAEDGSVIGVTAANNPREIRAGQALIRSRRPVDATALANAATPLQQLIPR